MTAGGPAARSGCGTDLSYSRSSERYESRCDAVARHGRLERRRVMLIDRRGLDVLDFASIRERYAGQTHAPRSRDRALACEPSTDFALVRRLVGETTEMRALARDAGFSMQRIDDIDEAVATAARGVPLPARELRAIGDALAAAAAALKTVREAETGVPPLRGRC